MKILCERRVTPALLDILEVEFDGDIRCQFQTEYSSTSGNIRPD